MGKSIAIFNQKGGVGKTTTNINLAACLAMKGIKVLVLDIDPQGNTTSGLGVSKRGLEKTSYDLLVEDNIDPASTILQTIIPGLDIIPASVDLAAAEIELVQLEGRERRLKNALDKVRGDYDYIFIDCPPSLGLLTVNALCAANSVLIPLQCEYFALEGLSQLIRTIRALRKNLNPALAMEGILFTMYDGRTNLTYAVVNEVKAHFADKVYRTVIPRNVRLSEAPSHGKPIYYYDKYARGAESYAALSREFLERSDG